MTAQVSECIKCAKPLGSDSKAQAYTLCPECRKCKTCQEPVPVVECQVSVKKYKELNEETKDGPVDYSALEVEHLKCMAIVKFDDPLITIRQSTYDLYNNYRLLLEVNDSVSPETNKEQARLAAIQLFQSASYDQKDVLIVRIEGIAAGLRNLANQDPKHTKEHSKEREKRLASENKERLEKLAKVKEPKATKDDSDLEEFTKKFPEVESTDIKNSFKEYNKIVKHMMNMSRRTETESKLLADTMFRKGLEMRKNGTK